MNFQEFLAAKRVAALVEHMDTLSEDDARDLFNQLDQATIDLIEAALSEGSKGLAKTFRALRATRKAFDRVKWGPVNKQYMIAAKAEDRAKQRHTEASDKSRSRLFGNPNAKVHVGLDHDGPNFDGEGRKIVGLDMNNVGPLQKRAIDVLNTTSPVFKQRNILRMKPLKSPADDPVPEY